MVVRNDQKMSKLFKCDECGCKFEAELKDFKREFISLTTDCPRCGCTIFWKYGKNKNWWNSFWFELF